MAVGSTGDGIVVVTGATRQKVWYASAASLRWKNLGAAPDRAQIAAVAAGPSAETAAPGATLIWNYEADDRTSRRPHRVGLWRLAGGKVLDRVGAANVPDDFDTAYSVTKVDDTWILGGEKDAEWGPTAGDPDAGALLALDPDAKAWRPVAGSTALGYQLYHQVDASFTDRSSGDIYVVSTDPILGGRDIWRVWTGD